MSTSKVTKLVAGVLGVVTAFAFVAVSAASADTMMASCYTFSTNLTAGQTSTSVWNLQKVLNSSSDTMVASVGAGSPGSETSYFGPATKRAVKKFQAKYGIPATGFVGPLTRGQLNTMCSSTPTTPTNPGNPGTPTTPTTGTVSVVADPNPAGTIISGSAQVPVLNFKVTNGTGSDVWVTGLKFHKGGVLSDSSISNAYVSIGNNIVAQYMGLSSGVVTFSGNLFDVPANSSVDATLRIDLSTGVSSSNIVNFAFQSASDVSLSAGAVGGTFPIQGGDYYTTSVSNPSLASLSGVAYNTVASTVDAGSQGFRASSMTLSVQNSPVRLMSVRYTVSGSINFGTDLQNLKLMLNGQQVGTATAIGADGKVLFDLSATPVTMNTGSQVLEVYTDVLGTPNRNFKFEILRPFDWVLQDTQYGTNISAGTPSGTATTVSVRSGTATVSQNAGTPTGNIPRGGSSVVLGKFDVRASGEPLRLEWVPFMITQSGGASWSVAGNVNNNIRNLALYTDNGDQIGTTINTPESCTYGTAVLTSTTYSCAFGSPSSNVNYIIPANTVRTLILKADLQTGGDATSLKASLVAPAGAFAGSNVEGQISFQTSTLPGGQVDGSILTISAAPFQGSANSSLGAQTFVGGAVASRIASFSVGASSAEAINLTSVTVQTSSDVNAGLKLQNLSLRVNGTVWNYVVPTIQASSSYTFSSPAGTTVVPAGGTVVVDIYGDVLSGSTTATYSHPIQLVGAVGIGASTNSNQTLKETDGVTTVSTGSAINGQNVIIASTGSVSVTVDTSVPPAQQIVLGTTNVSLGQFRFTADNNEDIKIDQIYVTASSTDSGFATAPAAFQNLRLVDVATGTTVANGTALNATSSVGGIYITKFAVPTNPIIVSKNQTKTLKVVGDVADYTTSPASANHNYVIELAGTGDVRAFGQSSNASATVNGISTVLASNVQTLQRTKITVALAPLGSATSRVRTSTDDIASLALTVDPAYGSYFKSVLFKVSGAAVPNSGNMTLSLIDNDTGGVVASSTVAVATATSTGVTLTVANPSNWVNTPYLITQGSTKNYRVRVDSSGFLNGANTSDSFSIQIPTAASVVYASQDDSGFSSPLGLQAKDIPITSTVSYE